MLTCSNGAVHDFEAPRIEDYLVERAHDTFHVAHLTAEDFHDARPRGVIGLVPGEIVSTDAGYANAIDPENDILKIAVVERHKNTHHIGIGYLKGYGLKRGAVATSISHDSHNIIVVGANEEDMAFAANRIVENRGGITVVENGTVLGELVLQIAGLMSEDSLVEVNDQLEAAKERAFELGVSRGIDPFMTLSFMSLPVIPAPAPDDPRRHRRDQAAIHLIWTRTIASAAFAGYFCRSIDSESLTYCAAVGFAALRMRHAPAGTQSTPALSKSCLDKKSLAECAC